MLLALGAISLPSTPFHPRRSTRICRTLMNCDALAFPPLLSFSSFSSGFAFPFPFPFSAGLPFGAICLIWGFGRCLEVGIRTVVVCANGGVEQGSPTTGKKKSHREAAETVSRRCHPNLEQTSSHFLIFCMNIKCTNNGYNSLISILYFLFSLFFLIELELELLLKPLQDKD
jgi:hypothetical protein